MNLKIMLPLLALGMMVYAMLHVLRASSTTEPMSPFLPEGKGICRNVVIAASGIVEAQTENVAVGTPLAGIVTRVRVGVGQRVKVGDALFCLDDRELLADLNCQETNLQAAQAQQANVELARRQLDHTRAEAAHVNAGVNPHRLKVVEYTIERSREQVRFLAGEVDRYDQLRSQGGVSKQDFESMKTRCKQAELELCEQQAELLHLRNHVTPEHRAMMEAKLHQAEANLRVAAEVARVGVEQARSQVERVKTQLEHLTVRALLDGDILQVNVRPGEYVGTPPGRPLVLLGNVHPLHIRVSIDEHESPRFRIGAIARAHLKGASQESYDLSFVRVEPFVVPKPSLTGSTMEKSDTRVLQVIYALQQQRGPLYVGQQMDVFIESEP